MLPSRQYPSEMPAPDTVEVSDCTYSYGEARTRDGASFQVAPRPIIGLLGLRCPST